MFAENFNADNDDDFKASVFTDNELSEKDLLFADELLKTIREHKDEIYSVIGRLAEGYKTERLYPTDKCALVLAVAEMKFFEDIPYVVSIDEAMYLVKKYSTAESANFVNGILAAYKKELDNDANN